MRYQTDGKDMQNITINTKNYLPDPDAARQKDTKLKKACKDFESILTYQLLRSMRKTVDKVDLLHGGKGEEIYESLFDMEISKNMSGFGPNSLAKLLYDQLKGRADIPRDLPEETPAWPIKGVISSGFGMRKDPITGENRFHNGLDIAAPDGTVIRAAMPGKVLFSGVKKGYGNVVILDHGEGLRTLYGHNRRNLVAQGGFLEAGTPLAEVGSSGRSTGPHLHFEVTRDGHPSDPLAFLPGASSNRKIAMK